MVHEYSSRKDYSGPIIFSNQPSGAPDDDFIGMDTHVSMIRQAIDNDNQLIGVLSDFGAGKSTLTERLIESYDNIEDEKYYKVCKINLWGEFAQQASKNPTDHSENEDIIDLHKSFLYQFAHRISPACGKYVNHRLNVSYNLLKFLLENKRDFIAIVVAVVCSLFALLITKDLLQISDSSQAKFGAVIPWILYLIAILSGIWFIAHSELIFSSFNEQKKRELHAEDYSEIYQYILKKKKAIKTIIIFEDIDRSPQAKAVYRFLIELHRYYVTISGAQVAFIINIKPQELFKDDTIPNIDFVKLFDYTLSLMPLNTADLPALLDRYVIANENFYRKYGVITDDKSPLESATQIEGLSWLAHGENLDIRHLKHRLNYANQLVYTLSERFKNTANVAINIQCCAIVAFLEDEYPKFFYSLEPDSIGKIISQFLTQGNSGITGWENVIQSVMKDLKNLKDHDGENDFIRVLAEFLYQGKIDMSYRLYFFNYPKLCQVRTYQQERIYNMLIYGKPFIDELKNDIETVCDAFPEVVASALNYLKSLGKLLPACIFQCEKLYMTVLTQGRTAEISDYLEAKIKINNIDESVNLISKLVNFSEWETKCLTQHKQIVNLLVDQLADWDDEDCDDEDWVVETRSKLTKAINNKAVLFSQLYKKPFPAITGPETNYVTDVSSILQVIDTETVTPKIVKILSDRFIQLSEVDIAIKTLIEDLYHTTINNDERGFTRNFYAPILCAYMKKTGEWNSLFETELFYGVQNDQFECNSYIDFLNKMPIAGMPSCVLSHIRELSILNGLNTSICENLLENEFGREYFCNAKEHCLSENWSDKEAALFVKTAADIQNADSELFSKARYCLCNQFSERILNYQNVFDPPFPIATLNELETLKLDVALKLLELNNPDDSDIEYIAHYLCNGKRNRNETGLILDYVVTINDVGLRADLFKRLDFGMLNFAGVGRERKDSYIEALAEIYDFNTPLEILSYIEHTQFLDAELEKEFCELVQGTEEYNSCFKKYAELLLRNPNWKFTQTTLTIVKKDIYIRNRPQPILEMLYNAKEYRNYVISLQLNQNKFVFESDKLPILGNTYFSIYNDLELRTARSKMTECPEVMQFLYDQNRFSELIQEALLPFSTFPQTVDLLRVVLNQDDEFIDNYFKKAGKSFHFADEKAKQFLLEILTNNEHPELVVNQSIWDAIKSKTVLSEEEKKNYQNAKRRAKRVLNRS